jgi:nitroreductase
MDAFETVLTRRSVRRYKKEPVSDELVRKLLDAGMNAPSAGNQQPWHFVVMTDRELLDEVPKFHPYSRMLLDAPLAILVCGDLSLEKHKGFWIQDVSAATENILIAAHALGLGAVWLGIHPISEREVGMRKLLSLDAGVIPLALISIGYPAETKDTKSRFNEARVHRNRW